MSTANDSPEDTGNHPGNKLYERPTWVGSDRRMARYVARPVLNFIHLEVASGVLLLAATAAALIWANSPWGHTYHEFWGSVFELRVGSWKLEMNLEEFVNDALMALFFFVVGLEIKRERVTGELKDTRTAALPALAALGGMIVPAVIYFSFNAGGPGAGGWGIPMATDIAFAVGVVALLGSRVSPRLKLFLLTLAIVDDIGAIAVIAIFYSDGLDFVWLGVAAAALLLTRYLTRSGVWATAIYAVIGVVAWYAMFRSGVHATIAGVSLGLLAPAKPLLSREQAEDLADELPEDPEPEEIRHMAFLLRERIPVGQRLETLLHPFTSFIIIPIFALANAGIELSGSAFSDAISSPVTHGVVLGLVVGKPVGITLFSFIGTRLGLRLPKGVTWLQFIGMGAAAGIGFTVSIFVTGLAFPDSIVNQDEAKIGILAASFVASLIGMALLSRKDVPPGITEFDDEEPAGTPVPAAASGGRQAVPQPDGPPSAPRDIADSERVGPPNMAPKV